VELKPDELLLAQGMGGLTALHIAAYGNHVRILEKLWVWAEEAEMNANELKKKLLLAKDDNGYTAWHYAAQHRSLEALETLCSFAEEVELKPDELLLAQGVGGITVLYIAAYGKLVRILEKLGVWAEIVN
jgi:ankyrin repeat protein